MQLEELLDFLNNSQFLNQIENSKVPNINLYMDQVLSFMNENLEHYKQNPKDKILTKSMINNYVKNELIPKPENKKYFPQHIISLIYIFYLKQILSLEDVKTIMNQYEKDNFKNESISNLYQAFLLSEQNEVTKLEKDLEELAKNLYDKFQDFDEDEIIFLFIMLLSSRANTYKSIIEKLTNHLSNDKNTNSK